MTDASSIETALLECCPDEAQLVSPKALEAIAQSVADGTEVNFTRTEKGEHFDFGEAVSILILVAKFFSAAVDIYKSSKSLKDTALSEKAIEKVPEAKQIAEPQRLTVVNYVIIIVDKSR